MPKNQTYPITLKRRETCPMCGAKTVAADQTSQQSDVGSMRWMDALARLADEMERKEEWWRYNQHDPHNISVGLMVAFAEIKTALRKVSEEATSASIVRISGQHQHEKI